MNKTWILGGIAIVALILSLFSFASNNEGALGPDSVLDKVLSAGTLRAGYMVYPPYIIKDPETGELSGIFYDITNALGAQLDVRVEWIEEPGAATIFSSLDSGRYDVYAGGLWSNSARGKVGYFTTPVFYNAIYAFARIDDHRFDNNLDAINNSNIGISVVDGTVESSIAKKSFPNAREVSLPSSSSFSEEPLQVINRKADVAFIALDNASLFLEQNPGTLRQVSTKPLVLNPVTYGVAQGQLDLQQTLNSALNEAFHNGTIEQILNTYDPLLSMYLRLAPPYAQQ